MRKRASLIGSTLRSRSEPFKVQPFEDTMDYFTWQHGNVWVAYIHLEYSEVLGPFLMLLMVQPPHLD